MEYVKSLSSSSLGRISGALLAEEAAVWASRKVEEWTGRNLGHALNYMPTIVRQGLETASNYIVAEVIEPIGRSLVRQVPQRFQRDFSNLIASPLMEECIFRLGIQGTLSLVLQAANVPPLLAQTISISATSILFGMIHSSDIEDDRFVSTFISGVVYGVMREYGGITESLMTHIGTNISVAIKERLGAYQHCSS